MAGYTCKEAGMKCKNVSLVIGLLFCSNILFGFGKKTFFGIRSQAVNAVRELVGWEQQINLYWGVHNTIEATVVDEPSSYRPPKSNWFFGRFTWDRSHTHIHADNENTDGEYSGYNYGAAALTIEYTRSFRPQKITKFLFGDEKLVFSGSRVDDRKDTDILADYFGLPADFRSIVRFEPRISNIVFDFNWYQSLEEYLSGLYFRIHFPVVHTRWDLNLKEVDIVGGNAFHPAGYIASKRVEAKCLATNVTQALQGKTTFGDMREPLKFGKVSGKQTMSRVAEVQGVIGWNFLQDDWYHFGLNIRGAAPTGNNPKSEFLFEPIVGNRHHWELGGGLTSHVDLWECEDGYNKVVLYFDANVTHLFSVKQLRSYDLKNNGPGSRYMLLEELASSATNLRIANDVFAAFQYQRRLIPAINKTTLESKIRIGVQGDMVLKVAYQCGGFEADVGYNFWGQSKEKLQCREKFEEDRFVLKGDSQVYGFTVAADEPVPLSASQSMATIRAGSQPGNITFVNNNADNPVNAKSINNADLCQLNASDSPDLGIARDIVQTSKEPIFVKNDDIDECSALLPRAISHKFFIHLSHNWEKTNDIVFYIGSGVSAEWANTSVKKNSAHSQWGIWIKGGLSY